MERDPDILLRILLGALYTQEDHQRVQELLLELNLAIVAHGRAPSQLTLLTACRELLRKRNPPPD
jgi:hypothetical protein